MFLTRIGFGSKAVITGDTTQVDVPGGRSGPRRARADARRHRRPGASCTSPSRDVVRHRIVQDIVDAYDRASRSGATASEARPTVSEPVRDGRPASVVFAADEQDDQPGRRRPLARLARRAVLPSRGRRGDGELSVLFVDEADDRRAQRDVHGRSEGPTDVLSFPIDGTRVSRRGRRTGRTREATPGLPRCWATS